MIPFLYLQPGGTLQAELNKAIVEFFNSGHYVLGDGVRRFEAEFAAYVGVPYCVGVGSGLDALHLLLRAYGIGPGDEVIVPSNTYIATWLGVTHAGATPVPVEPDPRTYNLDVNRVEVAVTRRTRAIIPVHLYGQTTDMAPVMEIADRHGLRVIEDAAQGHGARYRGARAGSLGHAAAFSFYPTKNLGAYGDAGAITTDDLDVADRVRLLRNYGSEHRGHHRLAGFNSRLDELQARLLSVRLRYLDADNDVRRHQASNYLTAFDEGEVILPSVPTWAEPVWHAFVIRSTHRDELAAHLLAHDIQTLIHYPVPPHLSPAYADLGLTTGALPLAELLHNTVLSLPLGPHLSDDDVSEVAAAVRSFEP